MEDILTGLNEIQKEAVMHVDGPMLILAGAGSGKTKTLTHRIAFLLKNCKVLPDQILAVTFTNKAANEMKTRLAKLIGKSDELVFLGTFHSVAVKILRREATNIGFSGDFLIYDQADQLSLIKSIVKEFGMDEKSYSPQTILNMISSAKNELIDPKKYWQLASNDITKATAKIYERYQLELAKANSFDFDDLITKTVELFTKHPQILAKYQQRFHYILIDEYQDTNQAQYILVNLLAKKYQNICVVGDDWQSIYSWRGANYQNILNFERDYPKTKIIKLEQNYRSTQNILDASYGVITKNLTRSEKKLWTNSSKGELIKLKELPNEVLEGQFVVETIEDLLSEDRKLKYKDFAVLYRTNAQSRSLEEIFLRYQIPYQIVGGVRFYERKEIKDILAYLRFVYQPDDMVSFERIVNLPPRGLGDKSLKAFRNYYQKSNFNLLKTAISFGKSDEIGAKAKRGLTDFVNIISDLRIRMSKLKVSNMVEATMKKTGYLDYLNDNSLVNAERIENLKELISVAKAFDKLTFADFLAEVSLVSDLDSHSSGSDSVTLMTLHSAKGLEFDTVFIVGVEENIFPHSRSVTDEVELEEERRLMYVGMTRAKKRLFLTNVTTRMLYGNTGYNSPSRFIADIPNYLIEKDGNNFRQNEHFSRLSDHSSVKKISFKKDDKVFHPYFGEGKVLSVEEFFITVKFKQFGTKDLNLEYAPIKKLV